MLKIITAYFSPVHILSPKEHPDVAPQLLTVAIAKVVATTLLFTGDPGDYRYSDEEEKRLRSALQGIVNVHGFMKVLNKSLEGNLNYGDILRAHAQLSR